MSHICHAVDCDTEVPPKLLFCLRHWRMLPSPAQKVIWRLYRPGQEVDKRPSTEYLVAQAAAVTIVAWREKLWTAQEGIDFLADEIDETDVAAVLNHVIFKEMRVQDFYLPLDDKPKRKRV